MGPRHSSFSGIRTTTVHDGVEAMDAHGPDLPRVLIVDDAEDDFILLEIGLQKPRFACRLRHAADFEQFVAALEWTPDVIVTDYHIGAFGAKDVLQTIAARGLQSPVIVLSGTIGDAAAAECLRLGAVDYVLKDRLARPPLAIEQAIQLQRLRREHRVAFEALQRNDAMMSVASRLGRVGAWSVELPDRTLTWSEEVRRIHDVPADFVPSVERAIEFYAPEHAGLIAAAFERCARDGEPFDLELELITASARRVWVRAIGEAERDPAGAIRRVHGAIQDISDRKTAALETRQLADRLTSTLESITDAFFTLDRDWRFTYVNREAERVLCRHRTELLGRSIWDEFPAARGTPFEAHYARALAENVSVAFEEFYAPLDIWVDVRAYPSAHGLAVYFRDSSQMRKVARVLRESEERYRLLFDANPHPVWVHDSQSLRILAVNNTAVDRYGYSREEFLDFAMTDLLADPEDASGLPLAGVAASSLHRLKDGQVIMVELTAHDLLFEGRLARLVLAQDITERSKAEHALRESERRFRELAENLQDVFYNFDAKAGRMLYVSPAYERVWGQSCERLYADAGSYLDSILPEDRPRAERAQRRSIEGESPKIEYRIRRADGAIRWVRDHSYPIRDSEGRVERIVGTARDITEQHDASEILRESEERFRQLVEGVKDYAILLLDPAGKVASWNVGAERLHGFSAGEIVGRCFAESFCPEDRDAKLPDQLLATAVQGGRAQAEAQLVRKDGTRFWASILLTAVRDHRGELRGFSKITQDISERKRSEERLAQQAALLDRASDAIMVQDMRHAVRFWSKGAERLYGWTAEEMLGRPGSDLFNDDGRRFEEALEVLLRAGEWSGEVEQRTKSNAVRIVEARWTLLRDVHGAPESVLVINSDVSEKRKTEAQFLRAQRMESIGTLAGGIAHDLNNLLAPITMGVALLQRATLSDDDIRIVETIERSADRGKNLVRQILSFARGVEGARLMLNPRYLLNEVQMMIADTFPKNIALDVQIAGDIWLVSGDPTQLSQVLLNLCLNARDAMPGGGRLTIAATNVQVDAQYAAAVPDARIGPYVAMRVADTSTGIPRNLLDRVFDPFFTTKEVGKGTGLGLATAMGITKSHGGFLSVQSELGKGSIFTVNLPAQTEGIAAANLAPAGEEPPPGRGETVLMVDDEEPIRAITKQTLEKFGYQVLTAQDGAEAIGLFVERRREIDALITDLVMPFMDGAALVAAVQRLAPQFKIIGITGGNSETDMARFSALGVKHTIAKPFTATALLREIRALLDEARR